MDEILVLGSPEQRTRQLAHRLVEPENLVYLVLGDIKCLHTRLDALDKPARFQTPSGEMMEVDREALVKFMD